MFTINKSGKISCIAGITAFVLSGLAAYSEQFRVGDRDNPLLSPFVNLILRPFTNIYSVLFSQKSVDGPGMKAISPFYVFEDEAIILLFSVAVIISAMAIFFSIKAARNHEYSFWYAIGAFLSIYSLFLVNNGFGILGLIITLGIIPVIRGKVK